MAPTILRKSWESQLVATSPRTKFGEILRELRLKAKLSQQRLSDSIEISPRYLQELESGEKWPSLLTVLRLAKALKVESSALLLGVEPLIDLPAPEALTIKPDRRKTRGRRSPL